MNENRKKLENEQEEEEEEEEGGGVDFNPSNRSSPGRFLLGWLAARPTDHLSKTHTTPMQEKSTMFHGSSRSGGRLAPAYDTGDGCTKPCTFYRAARTLCIIRSLLQAYANLVHAGHRIHCDERG